MVAARRGFGEYRVPALKASRLTCPAHGSGFCFKEQRYLPISNHRSSLPSTRAVRFAHPTRLFDIWPAGWPMITPDPRLSGASSLPGGRFLTRVYRGGVYNYAFHYAQSQAGNPRRCGGFNRRVRLPPCRGGVSSAASTVQPRRRRASNRLRKVQGETSARRAHSRRVSDSPPASNLAARAMVWWLGLLIALSSSSRPPRGLGQGRTLDPPDRRGVARPAGLEPASPGSKPGVIGR